MALGSGFWGNNYWPDDFWQDNYWPDAPSESSTVIYSFADFQPLSRTFDFKLKSKIFDFKARDF